MMVVCRWFFRLSLLQYCFAADVQAFIPLVPQHLIHDRRYTGTIVDAGFEDSKALQSTNVTIRDLAAHNELSATLRENGFELASLDSGILLPEDDDIENLPTGVNVSFGGVGTGGTARPLERFVQQFGQTCSMVRMQSGAWLCIAQCAGEIARTAGPDGRGKAGTPATFNAHVDQDKHGEPIASMGFASLLFRYVPNFQLVSIWMPLNDVQVRPLAVFNAENLTSDMLVRLRTQTYELTSDRFLATTNATDGWWFHSSLTRGQAMIMDAFRVPHTSFQHPSPAITGMRHSMEMRCAALIVHDVYRVAIGVLFGIVTLGALCSRKCLVHLSRAAVK